MTERIALIDSDILLYKFAFRNEERIEWSEEVTSVDVDAAQAYLDADQFIRALTPKVGASSYLLCLSDAQNFRYEVLPSYKHNRVDLERPQLYDALKDYLKANHPWKTKRLLEADDVMGIMGSARPETYVICSLDKDMRTIPGTHFNWNKMEKPEAISEVSADFFFYYQVLIGDSTDGYKGCPGIGPKKATKILMAVFESVTGSDADPLTWKRKVAPAKIQKLQAAYWRAIVATYDLKGLTPEDALQQARVARILRHTDYDVQKQEVKLWTPMP